MDEQSGAFAWRVDLPIVIVTCVCVSPNSTNQPWWSQTPFLEGLERPSENAPLYLEERQFK